jgi:hypothetical protein
MAASELFSGQGARASTLVAAAMETAGIKLQADMLEMMNGDQGQMLAGFFMLFAVAGGVMIFALGGAYKWGKYLIMSPAMFFFLTQATSTSDVVEWQFANRVHPQEEVQKALREVAGIEGNGGGFKTSLFFNTWNSIITDIVQQLIAVLDLTKSDSDLNFLNKVERYMNGWFDSNIKDENLKKFVQLALVNECADYYVLQKDYADSHISFPLKVKLGLRLNELAKKVVFSIKKPSERTQNELMDWLVEKGAKEGTYTCPQLWKTAVDLFNKDQKALDEIYKQININPQKGEKSETRQDWYQTLLSGSINIASGLLTQAEAPTPLQRAVDEYIARSLFREILNRNRYTAYMSMEGHSGSIQPGKRTGEYGEGEVIANTNASIQQFNQTEKYQYKGDFVNGALAMPHFQGVLLLLLAASYPFFALCIILPSRSRAMFTWMGLWVWAKSWDFGFAVVMMIDNVLYGMFPRGPGLEPGEIQNAGIAWIKILEVDPTYSANTYYTLIATCLYAVPVVTGFLCVKGGNELLSTVTPSWQSYATTVSGSAANYMRSLQAQTYGKELSERLFFAKAKGFWEGITSKEGQSLAGAIVKNLKEEQSYRMANKGLLGNTKFADAKTAALQEERKRLTDSWMKLGSTNAAVEGYKMQTSDFATLQAMRAVQSGWYTHDFVTGGVHPGPSMFDGYMTNNYINREAVYSKYADSGTEAVKSGVKAIKGK